MTGQVRLHRALIVLPLLKGRGQTGGVAIVPALRKDILAFPRNQVSASWFPVEQPFCGISPGNQLPSPPPRELKAALENNQIYSLEDGGHPFRYRVRPSLNKQEEGYLLTQQAVDIQGHWGASLPEPAAHQPHREDGRPAPRPAAPAQLAMCRLAHTAGRSLHPSGT